MIKKVPILCSIKILKKRKFSKSKIYKCLIVLFVKKDSSYVGQKMAMLFEHMD